jgi:hypothetical protein
MAFSSELWRIMAARQALECEEDHFDPVIKITIVFELDAYLAPEREGAWAAAVLVGTTVLV